MADLSIFNDNKRMKGRAPSPPQAPQPAQRSIFRTPVQEGGNAGTDAKENILRPRVHLQVTVPQGYQTSLTEDGSKALMDLLVELCSHFHLNPAVHTLELFSPEGDPLAFKPNALLGSLNVARVLIKEKVLEEKVMRRPAPKIPEKTVRLMVNYHGSQKAVVRVNPFVPLRTLLPAICEKCDFDPAHVLLLKDSISRHELQLDKSLTDLEIKELYVHDQSLVLQPKMASAPALNYSDSICSSTSSLSRTEKKSFLGIFHFSRRKSKTGVGSESQQKKRKAPVPPSSTNAATPAVGPPAVHAAAPTSSSESSTPESVASNDSSSELSHSLEDTDTDLGNQTGSQCSSLSSSTVNSSVLIQPTVKSSGNQVEESEKSPRTSAKSKQETTTVSKSRPETDLDLNLKLDEAEKRHSAMVWAHSMQTFKPSCQKPDTETPEEETMSFGSSSGGNSLPDQSFPAFEEMADGEDSGMVSSPSDTQPTSPEGSLSLDGCRTAERMLGPVRDNSSDSDEGCALGQSKQR
ncbi:unnamed protein product [Tetraodon nigroviridis]|uniref:(spotted green pufferfish) hypothetical protein n=1 Tax=Tetraodon nigroviridis TaxID=99883 RepID=Q4RFA7_TETNG|nr:unnamed protein product [Tetraodon nigroviridis]